jgi:hypothetical protein
LNKAYIFLIIHFLGTGLSGQVIDNNTLIDSVIIPAENQDTLILDADGRLWISSDSIDVPVDYSAEDKVQFDYANKLIHLYKNASIRYKTMHIKADYIRIEMNSNVAIATPLLDSAGNKTGIPEFTEGLQSFKAQKIQYNFKTKKGKIEQVITREGDLYVHGEVTKFISAQGKEYQSDDIIYNKNAIITSCDAEHPHYGVYSSKQKVIPNKLVIVGPSNVRVAGIPTPLWLPFGFFPISKNARAGILFPKQYEYDDRGFGLAGIGYYLPVSDQLDFKFLVDVFFKGSFKVNVNGNYKKRYKYSGSFDLSLDNRIQEVPNTYFTNVNRPISIRLRHNQEAGAHPYRSFGGSINIETNGFSKLVYSDPNRALQNILTSNFNYSYSFPNSPFTLAASMSHTQNNANHSLSITLPDLSLQMRSISPFKNKKRSVQSEKWYDRINVSYNAQVRNTINTTDTSLFSSQTLDTLQYGFRHRADVNASFKVLKYFNISPNISYNEELSFFSQTRELLDTIVVDTVNNVTYYGIQEIRTRKDFNSFRTFNAGASINTQIFGQILSSKGWFRGIRHQMTPSVSFNFSPDYHKSPFNYYRTVDTDLRDTVNVKTEYLIFARSPFGIASVPNENFNISFSLANRVEMKYYSKRDSSAKKIPILESFNFSGNYNVFADSFNLSIINGSGSHRLFKGITTLYYGLSIDPYGRNVVNGKEVRSKSFALKNNNKLGYITSAFLNINSSMSVGQLIGLFSEEILKKRDAAKPALPELFYDFNINHIINFRHIRLSSGKDTIFRSIHNLTISGSIPLSPKWKLNITNISYNFDNNGLQYPSLGLERDLHCWVMKFDWSPQFGYYSFFLGVKPGSLEFIRLPSNQSFSGSRR